MTEADFVQQLASVAPEAQAILSEHLADNGEVLLHPLVARMRDLAFDACERGDASLSTRLVAVFDAGLRDGADSVQNAVSVSFVEDTPYWDPTRQRFIQSWPKALRDEAQRWRGR
jgi:hypothetical protein